MQQDAFTYYKGNQISEDLLGNLTKYLTVYSWTLSSC
jgi:hypothetical protein